MWCGWRAKTVLSFWGQIPRTLFHESALKIVFSKQYGTHILDCTASHTKISFTVHCWKIDHSRLLIFLSYDWMNKWINVWINEQNNEWRKKYIKETKMFNFVVTENDHFSLPIKIIKFDLILSHCHRHNLIIFPRRTWRPFFHLLLGFQFKPYHLCFTTRILYALLFFRITTHRPALHNLLPTTVPVTSGHFSEQYFHSLELRAHTFWNEHTYYARIKQTAKFLLCLSWTSCAWRI